MLVTESNSRLNSAVTCSLIKNNFEQFSVRLSEAPFPLGK